MAGTHKPRARFSNRTELLDFLLEVSAAASSTIELDRLLDEVARTIRTIIPYELFAILLYSEKRRGLRIRYAIGHREEVVRSLVIPLDEGLTGVAASTCKPVRVGDVKSDPRYIPVVDAVQSELAVPMVARGHLVGVIDMQSAQKHAYSEEDSSLLQLIASRVAASVQNARLYRRLEKQNRTLRTLSRLSQEFSSILDLDELFGKVAATVREIIDYDAFSILLLDKEKNLLRSRFSLRYDERVDVDNVPVGKGITGAAAAWMQPVRVEDTLGDPRYIECTPGIRSEVAVPLITPEGLVGVMDLESGRIGSFTESHAQTLTLLGPLFAGALANARLVEELQRRKKRMEDDLQAAHQLQTVLLPATAPDIPGLDIAVRFRPAHEISGDLYDFFDYGDHNALIAMGDASGKSVSAALYAAVVSGYLRTLAPRRRSPGLLMQALNDALVARKAESRYATMLVLQWNPSRRTITIANAGAIPPIIRRKNKLIRPHAEGVPLGMLADQTYEEVTVAVAPGDLILLYSDGIQDQHNAEGQEYGAKRLPEFLRTLNSASAAEAVDALLADFDRYRAGHKIFDDQTAAAIRVLSPTAVT